MFSMLHLIFAIIQLIFAAWAWQIYRQTQNLGLIFLFVIALGLSYDNLIVGTGRFIGIGSLLETLSIPRFLIHAILTPMLLITGLEFAKAAQISWASKQIAQYGIRIISFLLIIVGLGQGVIGMQLHPACHNDTVRYVERITKSQICADGIYEADALEQKASPPLASIATIAGIIIIGGFVWRKSTWYWMMVGGILMFIAAAIPPSKVGLWIGNGGEIILIASMVFTAAFFFQNHDNQQSIS